MIFTPLSSQQLSRFMTLMVKPANPTLFWIALVLTFSSLCWDRSRQVAEGFTPPAFFPSPHSKAVRLAGRHEAPIRRDSLNYALDYPFSASVIFCGSASAFNLERGSSRSSRSNRSSRFRRVHVRLRSSLSDDHDEQDVGPVLQEACVCGASVSPLGFLILLRCSTAGSASSTRTPAATSTGSGELAGSVELAFPIQLTSSSTSSSQLISSLPSAPKVQSFNQTSHQTNPTSASPSVASSLPEMPDFFRDEKDVTSVTSPEALTFLQLLNGVDMATPILPPDLLSKLSAFYAFLMERQQQQQQQQQHQHAEVDKNQISSEEILQVEDELGLSTGANPATDSLNMDTLSSIHFDTNRRNSEEALNYICTMVRTTLPSSTMPTDTTTNAGNTNISNLGSNYLDASPWQKSRVQLPRVWLHGVRLERIHNQSNEKELSNNSIKSNIQTIPIKYVLECSVDDGSKLFEIPLFAFPSSSSSFSLTNLPTETQQQMEISKELLEEVVQTYDETTSASFIALSLFHRYDGSKSALLSPGSANNESPSLTVSKQLLNELLHYQNQRAQGNRDFDDQSQYCWVLDKERNDGDLNTLISSAGLPLYRPLHSLKESNQRVTQNLQQGMNFMGTFDNEANISSTSKNSNDDKDDKNKTNHSKLKSGTKLTLEQQAKKQVLKKAWKVAMERGDVAALEKIRAAMEELVKELKAQLQKQRSQEDEWKKFLERDDGRDENDGNMGGLAKIRDAMKKNDNEEEEEEDEVVELIAELEEATKARLENNDSKE